MERPYQATRRVRQQSFSRTARTPTELVAARPNCTMNEQTQTRQSSGVGELLAIVVLILIAGFVAWAVFIFSPGMVLAAVFKSWFSCSWDTSQLWTFGITISVAVWFGFYIGARDFRTGFVRYLVLCGIILGGFAFSHFGLKSKFTDDAILWYFPQSADTPTPSPSQN